jgi:DNA-binding NarL/FixJ family response regulator
MTTTPSPIRILIADDHDVMRQGTRSVIEREPGWEVCGVACTGREAVTQASELAPDIVIMDMTMPELNGLEAALQIKRRAPHTEILMFTAHESDNLIQDAFAVGVKSFILKSEGHHFLVEAIESLARHKPFFTSKVSEILFSNMLNRREDHVTQRNQRSGSPPASAKSSSAWPKARATKRQPKPWASACERRRRIAPASCANSISIRSQASFATRFAIKSSSRKCFPFNKETHDRTNILPLNRHKSETAAPFLFGNCLFTVGCCF